MILVAEPILGPQEQAAVADVLRSGWITQGPAVREFEQTFAQRHGAADAVAVNSCTAALHLALAALDIGPGDEVIAPSLTFVATVNAILYTGACPVLVDIEALDVPLISIALVEAAITPRTRAIVMMHFGGHLADPDPWRALAKQFGLWLIEDTAHAIGVPGVGHYGEAAAFSFYGNKNMTTAEGGMVLMRDPVRLERVRRMRGHGITSSAHDRLIARSAHYDVTELGFNYRMDDLRAAIGLVQLGQLNEFNCIRTTLVAGYLERLERLRNSHHDLIVPQSRSGNSAHHIMPILVPALADRDTVAAKMQAAGIQTTIHYPPVHTLTYHRTRLPGLSLPLSEEFHHRVLTLPLHPRMSEQDLDHVVAALEEAI